MDFSRRGFLRSAGTGVLTVAISGGLHGHAYAAEAHIKSVHGSGFCNLNYFLTEAKQLAKDDGVILDFVLTPTSAEMVTFLGAGQVDAALIPYTSFIALYDKGAPVKIVAGAPLS
jgi:NitT/TauT family transport system substrate-binding protein